MEVIKYRQYRFDELRETFFRNPVFFSRSAKFRSGLPGKADTVEAFFIEEGENGRTKYCVDIRAELQKQVDYVGESLAALGYEWIEEQSVWTKAVRVSGKPGTEPLGLLVDALRAMDEVSNKLPIALYETRQAKSLRDYILFMTAWKNRMNFSAIVGYCGAKRSALRVVERKAAQSEYLRRGLGAMADSSCIAELPGKRWCAWVDGDEAIPVFPSEKLAVRFLEDRHDVYCAG